MSPAVEIYAVGGYSLANCIVGTFYVVSGDTLKCRDSEAIGAVTGGSKQTFSSLDISVEAGDYIGIYYTSGRMEVDTTGEGNWLVSGQFIDPGDETTYSFTADRTESFYGTGVEVGWTGKVCGITNPAKVMGIAVANINKVSGVA